MLLYSLESIAEFIKQSRYSTYKLQFVVFLWLGLGLALGLWQCWDATERFPCCFMGPLYFASSFHYEQGLHHGDRRVLSVLERRNSCCSAHKKGNLPKETSWCQKLDHSLTDSYCYLSLVSQTSPKKRKRKQTKKNQDKWKNRCISVLGLFAILRDKSYALYSSLGNQNFRVYLVCINSQSILYDGWGRWLRYHNLAISLVVR